MTVSGIRRSLCLLLALLASLGSVGLLAGCGKSPDVTIPVCVEGAIFGGASDDRIATDVVFNPDWITKASESKYNADLAAFSALLCADSYFREKDVAKGTQNRVVPLDVSDEEYGYASLLSEVGFTDVRHVKSFKVKEYATDTNDSVTLTLAYCAVGKKYDAFIVVVRGCFSAQEWVSAFDPGFDDSAYTSLTGEHPEWTDKNICKGYSVAVGRAMELVLDYVKEHDDPKRKNCMLITGHSRGGAVANVLGAKLEPVARTYTYTFNAPAVIDKNTLLSVRGIFNLFDESDFYTNPMPFGDEPLARYGKDMKVRLALKKSALTELKYLKGRSDYVSTSAEMRASYRKMFGSRFKDRASLYVMHESTMTFATLEEAAGHAELLGSMIGPEGLDLGKYVSVGDVQAEKDGSFTMTFSYCDAALLVGYAKLLAYGQPAYEAFTTVFSSDAEGCAIADLLMQNTDEMTGGHLLVNSYVLCRYVN